MLELLAVELGLHYNELYQWYGGYLASSLSADVLSRNFKAVTLWVLSKDVFVRCSLFVVPDGDLFAFPLWMLLLLVWVSSKMYLFYPFFALSVDVCRK